MATPEMRSDEAIDPDLLPPGQLWAIGPGLDGSAKGAEQYLYAAGCKLVGDRDPHRHQYTIQMQPRDNERSRTGLGLPILAALVGGLLERRTRGATIIARSLKLGGSLERLPDPVAIAELAVDKQAKVLLMPVSARRELMNIPDDLWTKVNIEFYLDAEDGVFKLLE